MGCDLHSHVEIREVDGWQEASGLNWGEYSSGPFENRNYGVYGFLSGVRNYSAVDPICDPKGFPDDASKTVRDSFDEWGVDGHTPSWLLVSELSAIDYDAEVNDRRVTRQTGPRSWDGGCTGEPDEGEVQPLREFLGSAFMRDLDRLRVLDSEANIRVVFWFDN